MPQLHEYIKLCAEADGIMFFMGTRDLCKDCASKDATCCESFGFGDFCKHLTPSGCGDFSLGCKLWMCNKSTLQETLKEYPNQVKRLKAIFDIGVKNNWIGCRVGIEEIKNGTITPFEKFKEGFEYLNA